VGSPDLSNSSSVIVALLVSPVVVRTWLAPRVGGTLNKTCVVILFGVGRGGITIWKGVGMGRRAMRP
jgi:hypothetical protein